MLLLRCSAGIYRSSPFYHVPSAAPLQQPPPGLPSLLIARYVHKQSRHYLITGTCLTDRLRFQVGSGEKHLGLRFSGAKQFREHDHKEGGSALLSTIFS